VVSQQRAIEVVRKHLAFEAARPKPARTDDQALVVTGAREHRLGWLVFCQGERYVRTREFSDMLIGHGCFLVDALDASLHQLPSATDPDGEGWISRYLQDVRGVARIDPLRSRVADLLQEGNRLEAIKAVRAAVHGLDPVSAKRYIDAVAAQAPIPEDLAARIPQPQRPRAGHMTLTGPNPQP
jgi:hypothetical protein